MDDDIEEIEVIDDMKVIEDIWIRNRDLGLLLKSLWIYVLLKLL